MNLEDFAIFTAELIEFRKKYPAAAGFTLDGGIDGPSPPLPSSLEQRAVEALERIAERLDDWSSIDGTSVVVQIRKDRTDP